MNSLEKEMTVIPEEDANRLQDFVDKRGRPAVFLLLPGLLDHDHVIGLRNCLRNKEYEELDLVIESKGGDIHAAYLIIALLRLHVRKEEKPGKLNACVPLQAKSAATLLCLGADKIVLDEIGQLGPLDTQIKDDKTAVSDTEGYSSALHPFKALEHVQEFSLTSLSTATSLLFNEAELSLDDSLRHALNFVGTTTSPLFKQFEPQKFGIYSRALSVGEEYGKRVLQRFRGWDEDRARTIISKIINDYPSHHYIIDLHELKEMDLEAELFPKDQRDVVDGILDVLDSEQPIVTCVEPTQPDVERLQRYVPVDGQVEGKESQTL